jgi:GMP synthase (glutamine-hydrolysing)
LQGVADPEAKRKIIGREFVEVFQREAAKLGARSGWRRARSTPTSSSPAAPKTKKATTIKSHHNVGGLPETLGLKLLEPLRDLFKDEVRELGVALGLPHDDGLPPPLPRAGPGRAHPRRGQARVRRAAAPRRRDLHRRAARGHRSKPAAAAGTTW